VKKIKSKSRHVSGYVSFRASAGQLIGTLEYYSSRFFGPGSNPLALTGAIVFGFLIINAVTGISLLFDYTPTPELSMLSVLKSASESSILHVLRATHRASADLLILSLVIHIIRVWATNRYSGARRRTWTAGVVALVALGIIGWAGYILPWDERAMVLLSWGRDIVYGADRWPLIGLLKPGTIFGMAIFSVKNEAEQLLRIFALHVGGAFILLFVILAHFRMITPPRIRLPIMAWLGLLMVLTLVGASTTLSTGGFHPFNPFDSPATVKVDIFTTFPLLFYPILKGPILGGLLVIIIAILLYLPKLEPSRPPTAVVSEIACIGCRICYDDCPYGAIEMVPVKKTSHRINIKEVAKVDPTSCNSCGICVGSCEFTAIELPSLTTEDILDKIDFITSPLQERMK
jgi:quinol-cytochrome oxidoreductase complex cytochrome b subunit